MPGDTRPRRPRFGQPASSTPVWSRACARCSWSSSPGCSATAWRRSSPLLPPHPATARVAATVAASVSMAVSGGLLIGRAPIVARGLARAPYQAVAPPAERVQAPAVGRRTMSVETTPARRQPAPTAEPERGSGSGLTWLLAVCCVAQFMVILDLSIVNVALPSIQSSLGFTSPELQWIVDAYAITFAGFLMLGGRAADHFGQRRMFVMALLVFALASLAGGVAADRDDADRRARGAGRRRRADGSLLAGDHHLLVRTRPAAQPRDRRVGGDERARRRRRDAVRGDHHPGALVALGAADQPSDRRRRRGGRIRGRQRAPPGRVGS